MAELREEHMLLSRKRVLRLLVIAVAMAALGLVFVNYTSRSGAFADPPPKCPNVACAPTGCWSDGTVPNTGTMVKRLSRTPSECGNNLGGCQTLACQ